MTYQAKENIRERSLRDIQTLKLAVLSPVHIGTREGKMTGLEFVFSQGQIYLIDEEKFGRYIKERNLIDHFVQTASTGPIRMERFLRETARLSIPGELPRLTSRSIPGGEAGMQDLRPFIRDAMGQVYLPGTSLKGVVRTAVLYRMLKKNPSLCSEIASKAEAGLDRMTERRKKFYSAQWLQEDHLQHFALPGGKPGPNEDLMRCLTIRDAYPVGGVRTQIIPIHFLSRNAEGEHYWSQQKNRRGESIGKELCLWVEAVVGGTFLLEISWDESLFSQFQAKNPSSFFPVSGLNNLLSALQEMNQDLVEHEKKFFERVVPKIPAGTTVKAILRHTETVSEEGGGKAAANLRTWYGQNHGDLFRTGFGSGMLSTTVDLALPPELRQKIRDACGIRRPGDPAPKSRRVWRKSDNEVLPLGWMGVV